MDRKFALQAARDPMTISCVLLQAGVAAIMLLLVQPSLSGHFVAGLAAGMAIVTLVTGAYRAQRADTEAQLARLASEARNAL